MRPRTAARFALALVVLVALHQLGFRALLSTGARTAGGWGLVVALVVGGAVAALSFTAVYDGPRAVLRLIRPSRRTTGIRAR
ncbi:MAG: hypothetical protein M3163_07385 [Actinomycetota bacterium]|nr:hypothetical protein [Actinomycetota bacterium]